MYCGSDRDIIPEKRHRALTINDLPRQYALGNKADEITLPLMQSAPSARGQLRYDVDQAADHWRHLGHSQHYSFVAHAADIDWKVYGLVSVLGPEVCFYEALSIARTLDGLTRLWTRRLS